MKICTSRIDSMNMYSNKLIKCEYGYHAPGYCKVIDLEERMCGKDIFGKVCVLCDRVLRHAQRS